MTLKNKLQNNELTFGSWITLNSYEIAELMSQFDFDWLTIDMEHSATSISDLPNLLRGIQIQRIPALVRVEENDPNVIKRVMDMGADGVIVPMVKTKQDAEAAVASVKYPPEGKRGVGLSRAQKYGMKFNEYKQWVRNESVVIVIIEHVDAVNNLEEILSVSGVDASMIGPYDLSGSLGYPGDYHREDVKKLIAHYLEVCKKLNKPAGFHSVAADTSLIKEKIKEGFKFLAYSADSLLLVDTLKNGLSQIKGELR